MGLASKLQAASAAAAAAGSMMGAPPVAGAAPAPYAQPWAPPAQPSAPPAPAGSPYPPGAFGPGPSAMAPQQPPPANAFGGPPPPAAAYGARPPPANAFGAPPPANAFGAPPPASAFGAPPPANAFGAPPPASAFGAPPPASAFGAPPPANAFGAPPPASAFGAPPPANAFGAPPQAQQPAPYPTAPPAAPLPPGAPGRPPGAAVQPPPPAATPAGGAGGMQAAILAVLTKVAAANSLQRFYPPQALDALAARLDSRVDFRALAARWRMPVELALDLAGLALYDIVLFADDSGSMAFEEGGERIDDLKLVASKVAEVATLFDDDGILVRFMNSPLEGNAVRSAADVAALLSSVQYTGLTPLGTSLQSRVLQPLVLSLAARGALAKPVLVIAITDGEPTDTPRDLVVQVIKEARQRLAAYGPKAVAFEFAQVGKDQRAQAFLGELDRHPEVGGSIDCTSYFELESAEYARRGVQLSPEMWLVKMMVGGIDPDYDEADE